MDRTTAELLKMGALLDEQLRLDVDRTVRHALEALGVEHERPAIGAFLAHLPEEARGDVPVWLVAGDHGLLVEAFFVRRPEEHREAVYGLLLARNARTAVVHFALDEIGDVYLTGTLPLRAVDEQLVDRALGQVLTHVSEAFTDCVELGFAGALSEERAKWTADGAGRRPSGPGTVETPSADPRR